MSWLWVLLAAAVAALGIRHRRRVGGVRAGTPAIDDDAVQRIIDQGRLGLDEEDDGPLDLQAAAEAEEEFWDDWEDPEEYRP